MRIAYKNYTKYNKTIERKEQLRNKRCAMELSERGG